MTSNTATASSPTPTASAHHGSSAGATAATSCSQTNHTTASVLSTTNTSSNNLNETHSNSDDYGSPKSTHSGGNGGTLPAFQRIATSSYNQSTHAANMERYGALSSYRTHVS